MSRAVYYELHAPILSANGKIKGVAVDLQVRWDRKGQMQMPAAEAVIVVVHIGTPAKLICHRDGRRFSGTSVHGDIDIIPAGVPHRWEMLDDNDKSLTLVLPQPLLRSVASQSGLNADQLEIQNRFQFRDTEMEALCWTMKREMDLGYPTGPIYLDALSLAVASRLVMRHSSVANPVEQRSDVLAGRRLKQVLSYIEERLAEEVTLEDIASYAGLSSSYLNNLFRAAIGKPLHQYLIERRVERARQLLESQPMSIAEVALAAGFSHQSHMARHMRRVLGMAPLAVKRHSRIAGRK